MLRNRQSLAMQICLMKIRIDNNSKPDIKKIRRMPETKLRALYSNLKQKLASDFYNI